MVSYKKIQSQLKTLGLKFRFVGRSELKQLSSILEQGEEIKHCIHGRYQGGTSLLVATDNRILLIDKRLLFMNIENINYESISDLGFSRNFLSASISLKTGNKKLKFSSFTDAGLRSLHDYALEQSTTNYALEAALDMPDKAPSDDWKSYPLLPRPRITKY